MDILLSISPSVWVAAVILGLCGMYLTSGKKDEDGEFVSGVGKMGLLVVSLLLIMLMVRFGLL